MRKIVSISTVQLAAAGGSNGQCVIYAVADDGTLWRAESSKLNASSEWRALPALPQPATYLSTDPKK